MKAIKNVYIEESGYGFYMEFDLEGVTVQIKRPYPDRNQVSWEYGVKTQNGFIEADEEQKKEIIAYEYEAVKIWKKKNS